MMFKIGDKIRVTRLDGTDIREGFDSKTIHVINWVVRDDYVGPAYLTTNISEDHIFYFHQVELVEKPKKGYPYIISI